jgi:hypothetical protein
VLVEAVTSHGPVNPKCRSELKWLFQNSSAGLVFVTAFLGNPPDGKPPADFDWEAWLGPAPECTVAFYPRFTNYGHPR